MGIREKINAQPGIGVGVVLVLFLIAGATAYKLYSPANAFDPNGTFYSDDDGQTYFKASVYKFAPFDHDGKTAVLAAIYFNGDQNFVGYLLRYTPAAQKRLQEAYDQVNAGTLTIPELRRMMGSKEIAQGGREAKLPGGSHQWIALSKNPPLNFKVPGGGPCVAVSP